MAGDLSMIRAAKAPERATRLATGSEHGCGCQGGANVSRCKEMSFEREFARGAPLIGRGAPVQPRAALDSSFQSGRLLQGVRGR